MSLTEAINAIREISNELIALPEDNAYNELTKSYFSELERELKPAAYLTPTSALEVPKIVRTLHPFEHELKIAICGSGQQATPTVANVRNGLTIHLQGLRGITIDSEGKIISIAAGEKMTSVYEKATALGLGVSGNRHSSGGIGGDALQGGLSYFSYARGFVCDDVVNFEVVLASGEIVNANAKTNSDLWLALKGGGNNFGIVTRFEFNVFDLAQMWGGKLFYFQPSFPGQIQSLVEYLHDPNADVSVHICLSLGYAAALGDIMCMNDIFCSRPERPKALEPFASIQPQIDQMNTLRVGRLKGFTNEAFSGASSNRLGCKMTTTVKADASILEYAFDVYRASFQKLKEVTNLLFSITFEPIPKSMIEQSLAKGGNSLGLTPEDGPLVVVLLYTSWDEASDDREVYDINKESLIRIGEEALKKGLSSRYRYMNYTFTHQDPIGSYGEKSNERLRSVSEKYDPEGYFQSVNAGPFKISK